MGFGGIDVKSSRVGRGAAAVAVVAVAALGMSGCAAFGGVGGGAVAEGAERPENALPPGVLPPNDPPQPGDARLGPDGHYDYSAPDFVLKNPCDTDAYQVALQKGWEPPVIGSTRYDADDERSCSITKESTGMVLFSYQTLPSEFEERGSTVHLDSAGPTPIYVIQSPHFFGDSCFAGVESPSGLIGALTGNGGFSNHTTIESACEEAIDVFDELFGGDNAV